MIRSGLDGFSHAISGFAGGGGQMDDGWPLRMVGDEQGKEPGEGVGLACAGAADDKCQSILKCTRDGFCLLSVNLVRAQIGEEGRDRAGQGWSGALGTREHIVGDRLLGAVETPGLQMGLVVMVTHDERIVRPFSGEFERLWARLEPL